MNYILEYMITPKSVMDLQPNPEKYIRNMKVPYIESITIEAESKGAKIGEIKEKDYGMRPKKWVARLNRKLGLDKEQDCESRVIGFGAKVLGMRICL